MPPLDLILSLFRTPSPPSLPSLAHSHRDRSQETADVFLWLAKDDQSDPLKKG